MRFRPMPVLTVFTLASLVILLWLGNWQYSRFQQKMALEGVEPEWAQFEGQTLGGLEAVVYSFVDGQSAWRRVEPVQSDAGIVFVTREIIYAVEPPAPCSAMTCAETVPIAAEGVFLTPSGRGAFTGQDDPAARLFYAYDPQALTAILPEDRRGDITGNVFEPREVVRTEAGVSATLSNPFARLGDGDELPPQRHFGYAITWWGLAIALFVMYFVFHAREGRLTFKRGA